MERLRYQLLDSQQNETRLGLSPLANSLTVSSQVSFHLLFILEQLSNGRLRQVIARRLDRNGKTRVLVRWTPEEM
jgi:hypothetical protein